MASPEGGDPDRASPTGSLGCLKQMSIPQGAFGARPMARVIEEQLKKPLANLILFGELKDGGTAKVERKGEGLEITSRTR